MKNLFLCLLLMIVGLNLFAQTMNLEQARAIGLVNSRSLAQYEMQIRNSILSENTQLYNLLPSISASYGASMTFLRDWEFVNPIDTFSASLDFSVTQIIFQGGRNTINRAIRAISTESVRKNALAGYFSVLDAIDRAYYDVLRAAEDLEARESALQSAVLALSIAEVRHQSGMINYSDYLSAQIEKETRENSRNQARRNYTFVLNNFKTLIGITGDVVLEPVSFDAYQNVIQHLALINDEQADTLLLNLWSIIAASNPSLAGSALGIQNAEYGLTLARRAYAPTISARLSAGLGYTAQNGFTDSGSMSITLSGSIPIDFWVLNDNIESSTIARDRAVMDQTGEINSMQQNLASTLLSIISQAASVLSSRRSLELSQMQYDYAMERYRLAQGSLKDVNDASSLLITSRNNLTQASYSFLQGLSSLRSLCAMDDEDQLIRLLTGI